MEEDDGTAPLMQGPGSPSDADNLTTGDADAAAPASLAAPVPTTRRRRSSRASRSSAMGDDDEDGDDFGDDFDDFEEGAEDDDFDDFDDDFQQPSPAPAPAVQQPQQTMLPYVSDLPSTRIYPTPNTDLLFAAHTRLWRPGQRCRDSHHRALPGEPVPPRRAGRGRTASSAQGLVSLHNAALSLAVVAVGGAPSPGAPRLDQVAHTPVVPRVARCSR